MGIPGENMSSFSVYREADKGFTYVSNQFIDEFLTEANAAQIKVYLYLLRMTGNATSVSEMADKFNYVEKDICRALKYWEKKGLLALNYNMDGSVVGVKLITPEITVAAVPAQTFVPMTITYDSLMPTKEAPVVTGIQSRPQKSEEGFIKPTYSLDDLKAFKEQEDTAQIIFIAEQYLGKTLSPSDIRSLLFITDVLHFSTDLIDYLLAYCADKDKKNFRYIESVAINWAEEGITTPEEAKAHAGRYDKSVYMVMRALGKSSTPTDKEAAYVRRWINELGFNMDIIMEACDRSVMSTDKNRFAYTDTILKNWHKEGVNTRLDIDALDAKFKRPRKTVNTTFHQFDMKHDYDYDEIEKALLSRD